MANTRRIWLVALAVLLIAAVAGDVWAQTVEPTIDPGGGGGGGGNELDFSGSHTGSDSIQSTAETVGEYSAEIVSLAPVTSVFGNIVRVIETLLVFGATNFVQTLTDIMRPITVAAVALSICVFGVRLTLGGEKQPGAAAVKLLIMIGFIVYFTEYFTYYYVAWLNTVQMLLNIVSTKSTVTGVACDQVNIWDRMDCSLGAILGFGAVTSVTGGIIGLLVAFLFSGAAGIALMVFLLSALIFLITAFAKAINIYIISMVAITILAALAPLFLPTLLFQSTRRFFIAWLTQVVAFTLQPLFMFAFLSMMLVAFDRVALGEGISIYNAILCGSDPAPTCSYDPTSGVTIGQHMVDTGAVRYLSLDLFEVPDISLAIKDGFYEFADHAGFFHGLVRMGGDVFAAGADYFEGLLISPETGGLSEVGKESTIGMVSIDLPLPFFDFTKVDIGMLVMALMATAGVAYIMSYMLTLIPATAQETVGVMSGVITAQGGTATGGGALIPALGASAGAGLQGAGGRGYTAASSAGGGGFGGIGAYTQGLGAMVRR